ncbi:MAG TPA: stage III sporulation protein AE [Bacillota bacterium]|nr:stage III sporulation protein AE [Bacillota bacterium]HPT66635.1 stage III sporulation protein AE [Bacillota bacterium]
MRYVILFFLLIEAFFGHGRPATAYDLTPVIREELAVLPLEPVEDYLIRLDQDVQRLLPRWDPMAWAQNGVGFNPADGLKYLLSIGFKEVVLNFRLLIQIIALAGVCSVLHRLHTAWLSENVTDLAYAMTYLVIIGLAVGSFVTTLQLARETLDSAGSFLFAIMPLIFSLLMAAGGLGSAAVLHPMVFAGVTLIIHAIKDYLLPLIYIGGVIGLAGHLAEGFPLSRLAGLVRTVVIGGLGLLMTIFLGVISIQGLGAAVSDGVSLRTAKFLTGSFLPVVGGALADSMELAAGCSLVIKNALGTFGALVVLFVCLLPMVKIYAIAIIYRLASALVQPLGQERLSQALQEIANTFTLVFGALSIAGMMFFISLTVLVTVGNFSAMLR